MPSASQVSSSSCFCLSPAFVSRRITSVSATSSSPSSVGGDGNNDGDPNNNMILRRIAIPAPKPHHVAIKVCNITNAINFYSLLGFTVETKFVTGPARAVWLIQQQQQQQQQQWTEEEDKGDNVDNKQYQEAQGHGFRIELIEVPSHMLLNNKHVEPPLDENNNNNETQQQQQQRRHRAIDLMTHVTLLGLNHLALDVTNNCIQQQQLQLREEEQQLYQLKEWLHDINTTSINTYNKTILHVVATTTTTTTTQHITKRIIGKQVYEIAFIYDADGTVIELLNYCGDTTSLSSSTTMADGWEPWDGCGFVS